MQTSYTDGAYKTFTAHTAADLVGKEGYVVQRRTDGTIELFTSGVAIGALVNRLEGGEDWTVRLFGKGGTVRLKAGGVIAPMARVKPASGGKVVTIGTGGRSVGFHLGTANSADGNIIEVLDVIEPNAGASSAPTVPDTGNTNSEIGSLTFSSTPTQAEANALRDKCEELADDVRALHDVVATLVTNLTNTGIIS